jgi:excisionase family DNA binding protein
MPQKTFSQLPIERSYAPRTVAAALDVPPRKIVAMIRDGELKGFKIGRLWRIPESALLKLTETPVPNSQ